MWEIHGHLEMILWQGSTLIRLLQFDGHGKAMIPLVTIILLAL